MPATGQRPNGGPLFFSGRKVSTTHTCYVHIYLNINIYIYRCTYMLRYIGTYSDYMSAIYVCIHTLSVYVCIHIHILQSPLSGERARNDLDIAHVDVTKPPLEFACSSRGT